MRLHYTAVLSAIAFSWSFCVSIASGETRFTDIPTDVKITLECDPAVAPQFKIILTNTSKHKLKLPGDQAVEEFTLIIKDENGNVVPKTKLVSFDYFHGPFPFTIKSHESMFFANDKGLYPFTAPSEFGYELKPGTYTMIAQSYANPLVKSNSCQLLVK